MATIIYNPTSYNFKWRKYQTPPVPKVITFTSSDYPYRGSESISFPNKPAWLNITNVFWNEPENRKEFTISINPNYALTLNPGTYVVYLNIVRWWDGVDYGADFPITFELKEGFLLSITPTTKVFNYIIGGAVPQNEILQISSESNWNITTLQSWVTLSQTAGSGVGQIYFGVDPVGLAVGQYEAYVTVKDGFLERTLLITLIVTEGDTAISYLYVEPRNLQFVSQFGLANTTQKTLNLENSHAWVAVASQPWLLLSAASGIAGISTITVSVNSIALAVNNYLGEITFTSNGIIKKVFVVLNVIEFLTSGIESEGFYFCDDRNKLKVTNVENNTFLLLEAAASYAEGNINYQLAAPYFKGIANVVIGSETNNLLKSVIPTSNFASSVKNNIAPINIGLTAFTKNRITEATTQIAQYSNLRFLTGKTPAILNKLCYVPQTIYVTKNAVLSLSLLANVAPAQIVISGDIDAVIGTSISNSLFVYNAIINLSDFTLATGNAITITYGALVVNVVIKKEVPETHLIAFENEWREYELFETTGFLTETKNADKTDTELQIEGEKHTKTVSIDIGKDYVINTGYIQTQEEVNWLSMILDAKRIFIYEGTNPVEIILETKSLQVYKTREYGRSYLLKFKKAIV